ncbi:uncharacterized protein GGS25DRAFT_506560 [Hypoxylon fragiforme]|uniref:uncharacterized protein n=1 Tax=Hypoxylon fragiforme TaxID=63214 RepID=UPI0020C6E174|nr:uncharacterized protein GGS25DRAFT_506560 [Hypoxylon fragiforme]KAI2604021.1 hypothetical protein GGS25DRAFT_506560 [Hypoxylon fragiforme]
MEMPGDKVGGGDKNEVFYFAYGSNLSSTQMRARCPSAEAVGLAFLPSWSWLINERGYANIVPLLPSSSASRIFLSSPPSPSLTSSAVAKEGVGEEGVYGVLYRLPFHDEKTLDRYEGVPWAYEKLYLDAALITKLTVAGASDGEQKTNTVRILAYVDRKRISPGTPNLEYVGRMNLGIKEATEEWDLPQKFVDEVIRPFIPA